jgi:taurine dioxygenase
MPAPPAHAILAAQVLPEAGGDTMFASQYVAYETLSEVMKSLLREF